VERPEENVLTEITRLCFPRTAVRVASCPLWEPRAVVVIRRHRRGSRQGQDSGQIPGPLKDDRLRFAKGSGVPVHAGARHVTPHKPEDRPGSVVSWWYRIPRSTGAALL
jgi:hypothetical protein